MKEKGFTLIELLAVIVILAIIALIATPIILQIIDDSKNQSKIRSKEFSIKAINFALANKEMSNSKIYPGAYKVKKHKKECYLCFVTSNNCSEKIRIDIDGECPVDDIVFIDSDKKITTNISNIKPVVSKNQNIGMNVYLIKSIDESTSIKTIIVGLEIKSYNNIDKINFVSSKLVYNKEKMTYQKLLYGNIFNSYTVVPDEFGSLNITLMSPITNQSPGHIVYLKFETNDLDAITEDDFKYYIQIKNSESKIIPVVSENSPIDIIQQDKSVVYNEFANKKNKKYTPGDVNNDGFIDHLDFALTRDFVMGRIDSCKAMDVNGDGKVDLVDYTRIQKYIVGENVELLKSPATNIPDHL